MIRYSKGDLLQAPVEALVNAVNTVGVAGKGIALQFRKSFPSNYQVYTKGCKEGKVQVGKVFVHDRGKDTQPRYIVSFPTKVHWRDASKLEYIEKGMVDLVRFIRERNITSVAIPALGVGNGGLDWEAVRVLIEKALQEIPKVEAWVYLPGENREK